MKKLSQFILILAITLSTFGGQVFAQSRFNNLEKIKYQTVKADGLNIFTVKPGLRTLP